MTSSNMRARARQWAGAAVIAGVAILVGCVVDFSPDDNVDLPPAAAQPRPISDMSFFPYQDTTNAWWYTEKTSRSRMSIRVVGKGVDDEGETDYKVVFEDDSSDTNWFRTVKAGIQYDTSATVGSFTRFLPDSFSDTVGSFVSYADTVRYHYADSMATLGKQFRKTMDLRYGKPFLHDFWRLVFADSVGIVGLFDSTGLIRREYVLDSARVFGASRKY